MNVFLAALITNAITAAVPPRQFENLDRLDARVALVLAGSATAVPIDRRIKLAACPSEPEVSAPTSSAVSIRCAALGWKLRVAIKAMATGAGQPRQLVVHRGDTIELVARGAGYSVSRVGTALEEGPAAAPIRVKIPTSRSPVAAIVTRAGVAAISN